MTLMVTLAERWLVDVGFGDSFLEPLLLDARGEQVQGTHSFRIVEDDDYLILSSQRRGDWEPQYRFTLQPYTSLITKRCVVFTKPLPNRISPRTSSVLESQATAA